MADILLSAHKSLALAYGLSVAGYAEESVSMSSKLVQPALRIADGRTRTKGRNAGPMDGVPSGPLFPIRMTTWHEGTLEYIRVMYSNLPTSL